MGRPFRIELEGDSLLSRLPGELAAGVAAALNSQPFRATRHWVGNTADAYLFEVGPERRRLVLKVARAGSSIASDAEALQKATALADRGLLPRLVQLFDHNEAYLAEYVPGLPPPAYVRRRPPRPGLAAEIVGALSAYHAEAGCALGDFHPENITVRQAGVTLLDPGAPDQHGRAEDEPPMATDLGLWVHAIASNVITYSVRGPRGTLRMLDLAVEVAAAGIAAAAVDAEAVLTVATRHMDDLRRSPWPRDRITVVVAARPTLWWLKRRIRAATSAHGSPG